MTTSDPFERAAERERLNRRLMHRHSARRGFQVHLAVFAAVQVLLFATWLVTTPGGFPWFVFPLLGWGIGVVAHGVIVRTST